jgi:MFS transporter, FSR family, fosmidomycin resistance protein
MTTLTLDARQDYPTLSLVALAHGTSHFFHLILPPLFPWLMVEFGLNFTQAGVLMTTFFVVSGLGQALAGFAVDRFGASKVLFFGLATLACSALFIGSAMNYPMLILGAGLAGLGNSIFHPADYTILNRRISSARLGHAFSAHALSGNAGWVLAPLVMTLIAGAYGWRAAAFSAALLALATILILLQTRSLIEVPSLFATQAESPQRDQHNADKSQSLETPEHKAMTSFLRVPAVWMCFTFFLFTSAAFGVLQNYVSPLLGHLYGMSPAMAAFCLTAYLMGSTAGTAAGGLYAKPGRAHDRTVMISLGSAATASVLLASQLPLTAMILPLLAVMGFGVGFTGPSRDLMVRQAATQRLGNASLGRVYGFVYSGLDSGLAIGPLVFGPFMDAGAFSMVMLGVALLQAAAVFVTVQVARQDPHTENS